MYHSSSSIVQNNTIKNTYIIPGMGGSGNVKGAGIRNGKGGIIEFNRIINSGYIGIHLGGGDELIKNNIVDSFCLVKDDGGGIYAYQGKQNIKYAGKVIGNIVSNGIGAGNGTSNKSSSSADGIYMDDNVYGMEIANNTITGTHWGIYLHNAHDMVVTGNTSYNNTVQLYLKQDKHHPITNILLTGNTFVAQENGQILMTLISSKDDIKDFGDFNNNLYASANKKDMFYIQYKTSGNVVKERPRLQDMKDKYGIESGTNDLVLIENEELKDNALKIITNGENKQKSFSLKHTYSDKDKTQYNKSIDVPAYSSIILFKK